MQQDFFPEVDLNFPSKPLPVRIRNVVPYFFVFYNITKNSVSISFAMGGIHTHTHIYIYIYIYACVCEVVYGGSCQHTELTT